MYLDQEVNDYRIADGKFVIANGSNTVVNRIFTLLRVQLGEWYLNINAGINYLGDNGILGGKLSAAELNAIYRRAVLSDPDVTSINDLFVTQQKGNPRSYQVYINCTITGGSTIELTVPID